MRLFAHPRDHTAQPRIDLVAVDTARRLADVDHEVGGALELAHDLDGGDDLAQVARHWTLQGEHAVAALLERQAGLVEEIVLTDQTIGGHQIARKQDLGSTGDLLHEVGREPDHVAAKLVQLDVVGLA